MLTATLVGGCADTFSSADGAAWTGDGGAVDGAVGPCRPRSGYDEDGIPDEVEGCSPSPDTDHDGLADYVDRDSDDDGIPDKIEGVKDTDGDGQADYLDEDSDDDGVKDKDEDRNGDGKLGCCLQQCGELRDDCKTLTADGCGPGQKCNGGTCTPPLDFTCASGETDPLKGQTFPGMADADLPNFICQAPGEDDPKGLKPIVFHVSKDGDWKLALEQSSTYGEIAIDGVGAQEAGASFDLTAADQGVAGFIVSRPAGGATDVTALAGSAVAALTASLPGTAAVVQLSSGSTTESHDRFPTVVAANLAVTTTAQVRPGVVRDGIFAALLGKPVSKLPPADFGPTTTQFTVRMQTLLRKDGRVLVMGGVAGTDQVADASRRTGYHLDDLSNGTGLATTTDTDTVECDPFQAGRPVADIIWVIDESGSMNDNRKDIVANAKDFFGRAVTAGLDFRMGIAGMRAPEKTFIRELPPGGVMEGKLCGKQMPPPDPFNPFPPPPDQEDDGGPDRFLGPSETAVFSTCIENPPYWEGGEEFGLVHAMGAVVNHLPRAAGQPNRIRPGAALVVIIATDEAPAEVKSGYVYKGKQGFLQEEEFLGEHTPGACTLSAKSQGKLDSYVQPWIELFTGAHPKWGDQARAQVHLIGGLCASDCDPDVSHGYLQVAQATGGVVADVCQKNLGASLQLIIDAIIGEASPMVLEYVPISASIAVAMDDTTLSRSRVQGFDYVGTSNSLVFSGITIGDQNMVVASYRRWVDQANID